jgi:predicted ATPase
MSADLLERADHLSALNAQLASVLARARGRMVFVGGEAGVGKSALVQRFCGGCASSVRILTGACDPLFTPRPLGPLLDIAPLVGGEFQALLERGGRPYETVASLMRALGRMTRAWSVNPCPLCSASVVMPPPASWRAAGASLVLMTYLAAHGRARYLTMLT